MSEKLELIRGLRASEARLEEAVRDISPDAYNFRAGEGRWTVLEIVEHLAVFEAFLRGAVTKALEQPPTDTDTSSKEELIARLAETRAERIPSREVNLPAGRFARLEEALDAFHQERARTIAFVEQSSAEFRRHVFAHVKFGEINCRQWMLLLSTHIDRHLLQIAEVLAAQRGRYTEGTAHLAPGS